MAGIDLLAAVSRELPLPVGIGVDAGVAYVGNVGSGGVVDFTALGDPVNTAARLQSQAEAGEMVLADNVYVDAADLLPDAEARVLAVRGREIPIEVHVARISPA